MKYFRQLRTLAFYFAIPAISAATPLLVFPALTSTYGATGLAAIGIGQSLGSTAAVIGELGWGVLGPQRVARADNAERTRLFQSALATKIVALSVVVPAAAIAAFLTAPDYKLASSAIAVAFGFAAVSPSWFLIGLNRPMLILLGEALPRLTMSVLCAAAILLGAPLETYGIALIVAAALTWIIVARITQQRVWPRWEAFRTGPAVIRHQMPLTGGRIVSVLYTSLPVTIVALVSPGSTATFTAADRLMRMALSLLGGIPSRLQSWVGALDGEARVKRSRQSLLMNVALGLVAATGYAITAPLIAPFIFSNSVTLGFETTVLSGAVILTICASRGFGLSLVAEGKANWIAAANVGAAITGVIATFTLAALWETNGAILGGLAAEMVGLMIQAGILFFGSRLKRRG